MYSVSFLRSQQINVRDKSIGNGHNYELALVIDRLLRGGLVKWLNKHNSSGRHFITLEEAQSMFSNNASKRCWDDQMK